MTSRKDDANLHPHVVVSGLFLSAEAKYTLYVDGVVVCVVDCFMEALALHYAIFFVMDIAYPQEIYMRSIQNVVVGHQSKKKKNYLSIKKIVFHRVRQGNTHTYKMYREMYNGISPGENTVVHLYRGTFVSCCIPCYILKYHGTKYHSTFKVPRYIESNIVLYTMADLLY